MPSNKYCIFILLGMMLFCGIGCGKNLQVRGKVTFSDDGTPLDVGMILFENGNMVSRGTIKEDGTFTMGSEKQTDGLPPGTYNVYFSNAIKAEGDPRAPRMIHMLDPKFNSAETSGITITVDRSLKLPLEIKVDRFGMITMIGADCLTIDGNGATLLAHPTCMVFGIAKSRNVTLKNLTIDYDPLPYTQAVIRSIDPKSGTLTFSPMSGYADPVVSENYGNALWSDVMFYDADT